MIWYNSYRYEFNKILTISRENQLFHLRKTKKVQISCVTALADPPVVVFLRYLDSRILFSFLIGNIKTLVVAEQCGLCQTWSETQEKDFLSGIYRGSRKMCLAFERRCEKTGLWGFRPGLTQTRLQTHRR